jgi:hypothetical protein
VTKYTAGDAVIVEFQGVECEGIVIRQSSITGFVMAHITIDGEVDFGSITPRLDPQSVVCVPEGKVRAH